MRDRDAEPPDQSWPHDSGILDAELPMDAEPDPEPTPKSDAAPDPEPTPKPDAAPDPDPDPDPDADVEPDPQPDPDPDPELDAGPSDPPASLCFGCTGPDCEQSGCLIGFAPCGTFACVATQVDPLNCGGCRAACPADQVCIEGRCAGGSSVWLATGLATPSDLVTDGTTIYWGDIGDGTVNAIDKDGGTVLPLAQGQAAPFRLALDAEYVYWSNNQGNAIMRTPKDASSTPELVTAATSPTAIVLDSQYVYFAGVGTIDRAPKAGGAAETFVQLPRYSVSSTSIPKLLEMVSDGSALYVSHLRWTRRRSLEIRAG